MSVPKGRRAVLAGMLALMSAGPFAGTGPLLAGAAPLPRVPRHLSPYDAGTLPDATPSPRDLRDLWPGAAVTVRGEHSLVIGHGVPAAVLRDLAARADRARATIAEIWGPVFAVILFPATDAEAAALAGAGSTHGLAAMATADRVIVLPSGYARLTATGKDVVITHELAHVATGATRGGRVPMWLSEGFADYAGYRDAGIAVRTAAAELAAEVRSGVLPGRLPAPADFAPGAPRLAQAYEEAWLACRFVAERFGEKALVRLYGSDVGSALGLPVAEFTGAWRDYLRKELT
ncbi:MULTISPECIES: hypothetical protein [unclassified Streptosporangium]|uniref:hypothetical protein n=1 Tax=unclassified Streptosporangium TaxID=2632669 RepID=UPI002E2A382A|nr:MULTISPECIES: hypothetical protein [unclassified Streptosporangium]